MALQTTGTSQSEVTVHVTVLDPPQKLGATAKELVSTGLHPPVKLTVVNHVAYAASTWA